MACEFCAEPIALDQPCAELLCRHKVHTECLLRQATHEDILGIRCAACRVRVVPTQMLQEAEAINGQDSQNEVIRYFWDHEPQFKAGLQSLREARTAAQKANTMLGRKEKEIRTNLQEDVAPLVAQIEEKVAAAKAAHKALPEKKEADRLVRQYMTRLTHFTNRWGVRQWRIQNALRDVAAVRTLVGNLYGGYRCRRFRSERAFNIVID